MITLSSPQTMRADVPSYYETAIQKIEAIMSGQQKGKTQYNFMIDGIYPAPMLKIIQEAYKSVGWGTVTATIDTLALGTWILLKI